jgi:hypothetical protein
VTPLAAAASSDFANFNPRVLVDAVNALLRLGKDGALDAIERQLAETNRAADPQTGLFLVLRLLFAVPPDPGFHPPMHVGIPAPAVLRHPKILPHFPLVVVDDVPLLLVTTFLIGGSPQPVEAHLRHFRETGVLRSTPLTPKASVRPAEILDRLTPLYLAAYDVGPTESQIEMLEQQIRRMASSR